MNIYKCVSFMAGCTHDFITVYVITLNLYGDTDDDDDDREWDDYHQYHCSVTRSCYRNGREIWVDVNNLDDFIWIESKGEYHHISSSLWCQGYMKSVSFRSYRLYSDCNCTI